MKRKVAFVAVAMMGGVGVHHFVTIGNYAYVGGYARIHHDVPPYCKVDGSDDREIVLQMRSGERRFKGMQYLLGHAYPNFYFHVTSAYNILRHNGVEVGKTDFIGKP